MDNSPQSVAFLEGKVAGLEARVRELERALRELDTALREFSRSSTAVGKLDLPSYTRFGDAWQAARAALADPPKGEQTP